MINELINILNEMGIEEDINEDTNIISDLYLDSAELVSLRLEINKKYNVDVHLNSESDIKMFELKEMIEEAKKDE